MTNSNTFFYSGKIIVEFFQSILYFPLWWFTVGLVMIIKKSFEFIKNKQRSLGLFIWIKNIFTPMYGQRDLVGRLISFFMRLIQIFFRTLFLLLYVVFLLIFVLIWIVFPFFVFYEIVYQIYPEINLIFFTNALQQR